MSRNIHSVTGEISVNEMGITSIHEHIPLDKAGDFWDDAFIFAVSELKKAKETGLDTIVEVSPRRDIRGITEASRESGIKVLACTGFYMLTDDEKSYAEDQFYDHMAKEIEEGIDGTEIRPAVIKVAAKDVPLEAYEVSLLQAAAKAQCKYSLPICTHAVAGCVDQQAVLERTGADLRKVYFSHVEAEFGWEGRSLTEQIDYLLQVVKKGSVVSFNNFGNIAHTSAENLLTIIKALVHSGFVDNIAATMDFVWDYFEGVRKILWEDINPDGKKRTYSYLLTHVVPWLRENGMSDHIIDKILRKTPARLFR